jgi:hypothetical protein
MSLLTIIQNASNEIGFPEPSSVVGNLDQQAIQMLSLLNREGENLSRWHWQALKKEHTFSLVTADQDYSLPSDFRYIIPSTTWNRDNKRHVLNPLTSEEWQFYKGWSEVSSLNLRARIRNSLLEFEQDITSSENGKTIAYEYISKNWTESNAGAAQQKFAADDDVSLLDEELLTQGLIWRFKKAKGLEWQDDFMFYSNQVKQAKARDAGSRKVYLGNKVKFSLGAQTPEGNYGS